jgi:hypothetical protein
MQHLLGFVKDSRIIDLGRDLYKVFSKEGVKLKADNHVNFVGRVQLHMAYSSKWSLYQSCPFFSIVRVIQVVSLCFVALCWFVTVEIHV